MRCLYKNRVRGNIRNHSCQLNNVIQSDVYGVHYRKENSRMAPKPLLVWCHIVKCKREHKWRCNKKRKSIDKNLIPWITTTPMQNIEQQRIRMLQQMQLALTRNRLYIFFLPFKQPRFSFFLIDRLVYLLLIILMIHYDLYMPSLMQKNEANGHGNQRLDRKKRINNRLSYKFQKNENSVNSFF